MKPSNAFKKSRYKVVLLDKEDHWAVIPMILEKHYIRQWPTNCQFVYGIIEDDLRLVGTLLFGQPGRHGLSKSVSPLVTDEQGTELQRLYVVPEIGCNVETWAIWQAFRMLPPEKIWVVSYADPSAGHLGTIYQAANGIYQQLSRAGKTLSINRVDPEREDLWEHSRSQQWTYGRHSLEDLKIKIPHPFWVRDESPKYRYVWFLANGTRRKKLIDSLKIKPCKFPSEREHKPQPILIDVHGVMAKSDVQAALAATVSAVQIRDVTPTIDHADAIVSTE